MNKLDQLKSLIDNMQTDYVKFYEKGQNAAGTRLRKALQELRRMAKELRNEVQAERLRRKAEKKSQ